MKLYSIFWKFNNKEATAVFKSKDGRYYAGGSRLTPLLFTSKAEALKELVKLKRTDARFLDECFVGFAKIINP